MFKKFISLLLTVLMLAIPLLVNAQEASQAMAQAQVDASNDVSGCLWLGGGFLFGPIVVGAAYVIETSPSATRFLGKSPEYVATYTDAYKKKARSIQTTNALIGCLASSVLYAILFFR